MERPAMHLLEVVDGSTLADEQGAVMDTRFFVTVDEGGQEVHYRLHAVTSHGNDLWQLDREVHGGTDEEERFPLVVSDELLGTQSLVDYVKRRYLSPEDPNAVNELRQFLDGPLDDSNGNGHTHAEAS